MNKIQAVIVADSIDPRGNRITSFLLTYPRFIHSELMTHRMFSRNSASCLSGDTIITIEKLSSLKKGFRCKHTSMTIEEICKKWFNGDSKGRDMKHRIKSMNLRCLNEKNGEFITTKITNCFIQGVQDVYEIELENGYKIKCTENHRIFSENGWITLKDYNINYSNGITSYDCNFPKISTNGIKYNVDFIISERNKGKTLRKIAQEQGYNEKSLRDFCEKNKIPFKKIIQTFNETFEYKNKDWLLEQKLKGYTNSYIAELCNTTEDRVKKSCKKHNIKGYVGVVLKGNKKRESWNKGKSYFLPDSSLVNVRKSAKKRIKKNSYKNYRNKDIARTRFIQELRNELILKNQFICAISGCKQDLDLHHIDPMWNNPERALDKTNIIPLNNKIHRWLHANNLDILFKEYYESGEDLSKFKDLYKDLKHTCDEINKPKTKRNFLVQRYQKVKSITYVGKEETYDIEVEGPYHNFVANGIVVHNSRAIPFEKMVKMVEEDPFIPIAWQKSHKGMQGNEYFTDSENIKGCVNEWLKARDYAVQQATVLNEDLGYGGVTKQLCNRLLEPFMWHTVLVTATEWENFFELRNPVYEIDLNNLENFKD